MLLLVYIYLTSANIEIEHDFDLGSHLNRRKHKSGHIVAFQT